VALISGKAVGLIILALIAYWGASYFNVVPAPVQGSVSWVDAHTDTILIFFVAIVVCYVILQINRRKRNQE
jgi:hypothetical protein